ncbi:MAG: PRTRC system ThiF family protein [Sulfuriferula sp.]
MIHNIKPDLLTRKVQVVLVGAGGTGSHVLRRLANVHMAIVELGHPAGLDVSVYDPDTVSKTNVGRQAFYPSDVGLPKAAILVHRCNLLMQTKWEAHQEKLTSKSNLYSADVVIGCVDNRAGRKAILAATEANRKATYYMDFGNREHDGQVILGQVMPESNEKSKNEMRLPHAANLFPELVDESLDDKDETPSCSLAEALEKQSLFINDTVANAGMNMLWELFRYGQLSYHGVFINNKTGRVNPLPIDPEAWARFGYGVMPKKIIRKKSFGRTKPN